MKRVQKRDVREPERSSGPRAIDVGSSRLGAGYDWPKRFEARCSS